MKKKVAHLLYFKESSLQRCEDVFSLPQDSAVSRELVDFGRDDAFITKCPSVLDMRVDDVYEEELSKYG